MTRVKPKPTATRERPFTGWGGPLSRALANDAARRRPNKVTLPKLRFLSDEPKALAKFTGWPAYPQHDPQSGQ